MQSVFFKIISEIYITLTVAMWTYTYLAYGRSCFGLHPLACKRWVSFNTVLLREHKFRLIFHLHTQLFCLRFLSCGFFPPSPFPCPGNDPGNPQTTGIVNTKHLSAGSFSLVKFRLCWKMGGQEEAWDGTACSSTGGWLQGIALWLRSGRTPITWIYTHWTEPHNIRMNPQTLFSPPRS